MNVMFESFKPRPQFDVFDGPTTHITHVCCYHFYCFPLTSPVCLKLNLTPWW